MTSIMPQPADIEPERRRRVHPMALPAPVISGSEVYVAANVQGLICYGSHLPEGLLYSTLAGTPFTDQYGAPWTYLGVFEFVGFSHGLANLRLLSPVPCTEFDWCRGHELNDVAELAEPDWHEARHEPIGALRGHDVMAYRVRFPEGDGVTDGTAVFMTEAFDHALSKTELLATADELERLSKSVRNLARKAVA